MAGELVPVGGKRRQGGRGPNERRAIGELILDGRLKGVQMHVLADEFHISEPTAYRWMQLALDARLVATVDEYRKRENELLDSVQRQLQENLDAANYLIRQGLADEENPKLGLIERGMNARMQVVAQQIRLSERRSKLNGLDAPIRVDATLTHRDAEDAELEELIREDRARAAREAQEAGRG